MNVPVVVEHDPANIGASETWLREELSKRECHICKGMPLDDAFGQLRNIRRAISRHQSLPTSGGWGEQYSLYATAYGVDFLSKAVHNACERDLQLKPELWKAITKGDCNPLVPVIRGRGGQPRDLVWEVCIASLARCFCDDVDLEEPDVVCNFEGQTYVIAAKMAYSASNIPELIRKGIDQVAKSGHPGMVLVNLVSAFPLRDFFIDSVEAFRNLYSSDYESACVAQIKQWHKDHMNELARRCRNAGPNISIVGFCPFILYLRQLGQGVPFLYSYPFLDWPGADSISYRFLRSFMGACDEILSFISAARSDIFVESIPQTRGALNCNATELE